MILAGDIGGTKVNLAYFHVTDGKLHPVERAGYSSREFGSLEEVVTKFRDSFPAEIGSAAFGVPGPVVMGRTKTTNLKWVVDSAMVASLLHLDRVGLINDLQATAYGVLRLDEKDKLVLNTGTPQQGGTIGVIAAGTGLGEGALVWDGRQYRAVASEGGHSDFGPRNDVEDEILRFFRREFGRVSCERTVSGPGLHNLYRFFRSLADYSEPAWLADAIAKGDPSAAISQAASDGKDGVSALALDMFVSLYGAEAGNLALKFLATGGIFVGGGIAPKLAGKLQEGEFMKSFQDKGRYSSLLSTIPVSIILNDKAALYGAAHYALMLEAGDV